MAARVRFNVCALLRGHWKTLTVRDPDRGEQDTYPADWASRIILIALPGVSGAAAGLFSFHRGINRVDSGWIGVAAAAASLLSAALLGAFSLLGQWRSRLGDGRGNEAAHARAWPLRALIDEAVATTLVGVMDSAVVVFIALLAAALTGRYPTSIAIGILTAVGVHLTLLFLLLIVCLYSAYTQSEHVPAALDGHIHS